MWMMGTVAIVAIVVTIAAIVAAAMTVVVVVAAVAVTAALAVAILDVSPPSPRRWCPPLHQRFLVPGSRASLLLCVSRLQLVVGIKEL